MPQQVGACSRRTALVPACTWTPDLPPALFIALPGPDAATPLMPTSTTARPAVGLLGSAAVVFGTQRLVPSYDPTWYKQLDKPS